MPREVEHGQESIDCLAMTYVGALTLSSREFAEREIRQALGRIGVTEALTGLAYVGLGRGGRVVVKLRTAGDLHCGMQDPLQGRRPYRKEKAPARRHGATQLTPPA